MIKKTKPNIAIPSEFAVVGEKRDFSEVKIQNGFDPFDKDTLEGSCLNKFIDDTYKGLNYSMAGTDAINLIKEGETLTSKNGNLESMPVVSTDLTGLTASGDNRLHALKGYLDNGELLTDAEGLADVVNYAHSTFDLSKFTVTGTPTITDDGIASGLGVNNAIYLDTNIIIGQKPFKIKAKVNYPDTSTGKRIFQCSASASNTSGLTFFVYTQVYGSNPSGLRMAVYLSDGTNISEGISNISGDVVVEFEFTGSQYILRAFNINNELLGEKALASNLYPIDIDTHHLRIGTNATDVTYDLKYFDVDIDGVPVFSGNKTGTDTYTIGGNTVSVPYTLSKTGSKIVDSLYRTEVQAVYDQYGYAPYYTLSDTDFTLPMGELYGMIEKTKTTGFLGQTVFSLDPLFNDGLHLLDGALLQGDGVYKSFIDNYIKPLYNSTPSRFVTETAWQQSVSTYGVCGFYVYDSTNNTVRLPKVTGFVEGTLDASALGSLVEAGLPLDWLNHTHTRGDMNITGNIVNNPIFANAEDNSNGAFRTTNLGVALIGSGDVYQAKYKPTVLGRVQHQHQTMQQSLITPQPFNRNQLRGICTL